MSCERCWDDAFKEVALLGGSQADRYTAIMNRRTGDDAEQALCDDYNRKRRNDLYVYEENR